MSSILNLLNGPIAFAKRSISSFHCTLLTAAFFSQNTYTSLSRAQLEFPRPNLQLGIDLGEGRFGKVIQARAMNILGDGKWLAVAVKTCRREYTAFFN